MAGQAALSFPVVSVENGDAEGPFLLVCEHASNAIPAAFGDLGLNAVARHAHIAWDPGALGLARALAQRLASPLVAGTVSRLVYDLNRPPDHAGAQAAQSEAYDIPGNSGLTTAERFSRTAAVYLPFHHRLQSEIARRLAAGTAPVLVTVHSFTPVYFGQRRKVQLGVIHDDDATYAHAIVAAARQMTGLDCQLNQPYSAADDVTHTLRLQATPYGLVNVMLEIRSDLIASEGAETAMADILAPVLRAALEGIASFPNKEATA